MRSGVCQAAGAQREGGEPLTNLAYAGPAKNSSPTRQIRSCSIAAEAQHFAPRVTLENKNAPSVRARSYSRNRATMQIQYIALLAIIFTFILVWAILSISVMSRNLRIRKCPHCESDRVVRSRPRTVDAFLGA